MMGLKSVDLVDQTLGSGCFLIVSLFYLFKIVTKNNPLVVSK